MHIAFFSDQHPATLGGLQVSLGLQRKYLERAGHVVTVCAPASRRTPSEQYSRAGDVLLGAAQVGEHSFSLAGGRLDRVVDAGFAARPPVDVVHVQADVWGAWNGYRFAERHGLPVVHTMHTDVEAGLPAIVPFPRTAFRLLFALQERFLETAPIRSIADYTRAFAMRADLVIAPSPHFAERLRSCGVEGDIRVLPTGVDDDQLAAARATPKPSRSRPVLVWPGRVSPEKRLDDFLEALARSGADADVRVYGSGSGVGRAKRLAADLGLSSRVTFFGAVPHDAVLRAMRVADAVVQSSVEYETQGLTVYEAVSLGTPVILRDRGIARDLPASLTHVAADHSIDAFAVAILDCTGPAPAPAPASASAADRAPRGCEPSDRFAQSRLTARAVSLYEEVLLRQRRTGAICGASRAA